MRITESLYTYIENDRGGYQEVCSDCEAYGLKNHGLTRSDCISFFYIFRKWPEIIGAEIKREIIVLAYLNLAWRQ